MKTIRGVMARSNRCLGMLLLAYAQFLAGSRVVAGQLNATSASPSPLPYLDYQLPIEARAKDLVSRLKLDEKISLLDYTEPAIPRLGVRAYHFGNEALHGVVRPGNFTVFPMSIGLASTWDPDLIHEMTVAISDEARARYNADHGEMQTGGPLDGVANGTLTFWSPTINMARDPRWGRTAETYGEDPYLTSRLAVAFIHGLQGDDPHYLKTVATPKHFAAYNEEYDRFEARVTVSEKALQEYYLPPFHAAITEGKAESIMSSYNAINGVPSTANRWLLTELLRDQWKFGGYVVTDCGASPNLVDKFRYAKTPEEGAAMAINAGVDLECWGLFQKNLAHAKDAGLVSSDSIDRAVTNVLRARFRLGMFDPPEMVPYSKIPVESIGSPAHQSVALRAAQESMVLLKNDAYRNTPLLPLNRKSLHSIAVVGPYPATAELGDYSGTPVHAAISPLEGIRAEAGDALNIRYIPYIKPIPDPTSSTSAKFAREAEAARNSDVAIAFLGFGKDSGMEAQDRANLDLSADQQELIQEVVAANPRTIVVLISGGPLAIEWIASHAPAILEGWYPGEQGGNAIADVLFGKVNPAGRLPLTFYQSTSQLLDFHDFEISHGRTYQYFRGHPLYAFGHGLSYTHFTYSKLRFDRKTAKPGEVIHARFEVTNRGRMDGEEVVQLYLNANSGQQDMPIRRWNARPFMNQFQ
jgi:beta-glucosidase